MKQKDNKVCNSCKIEKKYSEYNKDRSISDGYENRCRDCRSSRKKELYQNRLEHFRNKSKINARIFRKENPGYQRQYDLKRIYGITTDDYNTMLKEQNNCCSLCKTDNPKTKSNVFVVDHCHSSGKVRALLCSTCNAGLGAFYDNTELLTKAIEYLNIHKEVK